MPKKTNFHTEKKEIEILLNGIKIKGIFTKPSNALGIILFAHGSGSSRLSPRNTFVAEVLQKSGFATLLIDLLTPEEEKNRENVFNINLLAFRLKVATEWILKNSETKNLPIGYFGASTGAAAALQVASELLEIIRAVVSRGGRPDLAMEYLPSVLAPTLLIVGERDEVVLKLNEKALKKLKGEKWLTIVSRATHLFEEPGALEEVAHLATEWFLKYLKS